MTIIVAAIFALGLMVYVFAPVANLATGGQKSRLEYLYERKDQIYENLRDLNFENKAGKYPEADFIEQRNSLENEAATVLAEIEALESN
jgi:hypothetical protein